jgi:hypothetical protein
MIKEQWKPIIGWENYYLISNHGRVKSLLTDKILRPYCNKKTSHGYLQVTLYYPKKTKKIHRLVAENFLKKVRGKNIVDHKDMNVKNNHIDNLRWCNHKENRYNTNGFGTSKYLGVSIHITKRKHTKKDGTKVEYVSKPKFIAHIKIKDKYKHIGLYNDEIEAAKAYDLEAKKNHGKFARLNFNN